MNIIEIDFEKSVVRSDYKEWEIISNNNNQYLLLQREESGRFHAAEAEVKRKQMFEVKEIAYRGPNGETFVFDPESGIMKI